MSQPNISRSPDLNSNLPFNGVRPQTEVDFERADKAITATGALLTEHAMLPEPLDNPEGLLMGAKYEGIVDSAVSKAVQSQDRLPVSSVVEDADRAVTSVSAATSEPESRPWRTKRLRDRIDARSSLGRSLSEYKRPSEMSLLRDALMRMYGLDRVVHAVRVRRVKQEIRREAADEARVVHTDDVIEGIDMRLANDRLAQKKPEQ